MKLTNPTEWWFGAGQVVEEIEKTGYATQHGCSFDVEAALGYALLGDHEGMYQLLNKLWEDLPDSPSIRHGPFFELCDLCSEYSVCFDEV